MRDTGRFLALLTAVAVLLVLSGILIDLHMQVDEACFEKNGFHMSVSGHGSSGTAFHGFSYDIEEEYLYITVRKGLVYGDHRSGSMDVNIEDGQLEPVQSVYLRDGPEKKLICAR